MKSSLFLMEQLISIMIFAICASVCVRVFAASFICSNAAEDMSNALVIAKNGAECYKATEGDARKTAALLGGALTDDNVKAFYDKGRRICEENEAYYILDISRGSDDGALYSTLLISDISVSDNDGNEILTFAVAARRERE